MAYRRPHNKCCRYCHLCQPLLLFAAKQAYTQIHTHTIHTHTSVHYSCSGVCICSLCHSRSGGGGRELKSWRARFAASPAWKAVASVWSSEASLSVVMASIDSPIMKRANSYPPSPFAETEPSVQRWTSARGRGCKGAGCRRETPGNRVR